jgi:hypothetical protein
VSIFDEKKLVADLKSWWDDQTSSIDPFAEPKEKPGTIFDALPTVDSLAAVSALLTVAKHVPFKVTTKIIKKGGYADFDDLVTDMLPKLEELAVKHGAKTFTSATKTQKEKL